jgi:hypothetical protein
MEELSMAEVVYLINAVKQMLRRDLCKGDRLIYQQLWMKLMISDKGKKARKALENDEQLHSCISLQ